MPSAKRRVTTPKIPLFLAAFLALTASPVALAASASSTDEARTATGASLPPECPSPPAARAPSSTDDARALAGAAADAAPSAPSGRAPDTVSSTDDARAAVAAAIPETPALQACAEQAPEHGA
jgi:hypothetical protein